ncbi:hypothetical protein TRAPUB_1895 [Trametes pubescens]|uniref:Uncharacterized protein n=1 Tax=Trametes pubescens TaxID=154538 RepID=A0A1M2VI66_TRAPU|nr:hypothetical protein TRAPUB_1895 [Trametes pubescens]
MERRPSMTMRIRKLSNTIKNAIIPSSSTPTGQPSRMRRVSVEDIGKPKLQRQYSVDFYLTANGDRDAPRPHRPTRPSMDERPPVVHDARTKEQNRRMKALMGTDRPREEARPHGAGGSRPKPPRASPSKKGAIPFPIGVDDIGPPMALAPREATHRRQTGESNTQSRSPPGPREALYTVFAPVRRTPSSLSTKTMPERTQRTEDAGPSTTRIGVPSSTSRQVVGRSAGGVAPENLHSVYIAEGPATVGRKGAIRRTSKTSNAPLPSPDLYNLFGRSEETLVGTPRHSMAGLQRSQSAATHSTLRSARPPAPSPLRPKPAEPRDVPHDVHERERTQSASSAGWPEGATERVVIAYGQTFGRHSRTERAQAQASLDLRCPPAPQVAQLSGPDPHRASSFKAEVGHVGVTGPSRPRHVEKEPEPEPKPESVESTKRERPGRARDGKGKGTTHMTEEYVPFTRYFDEVALKNGLVNGVPEGPLPDLLPGEVPGVGVGAPATAPLRVQKKEREGKEREGKEREGEASRLRRVVEPGKR